MGEVSSAQNFWAESVARILDAFASANNVLANIFGSVARYLEGRDPVQQFSKDLVVALTIAILSSVIVNGFLYRRELARRRKIEGPIRNLVLRSFKQAQGELIEAIVEFDAKSWKKVPTRMAHLGERLAEIRDGFSSATIGGMGYFEPEENAALAACVAAIDWTDFSSFDEASQWLENVASSFQAVSKCKGAKLDSWTPDQLRELRASFERITTIQPPSEFPETSRTANETQILEPESPRAALAASSLVRDLRES